MAEQRAKRRLAAILAADVVGYSRLMRADEAGTLAQLKAVRKELLDPKIAEYGGRIVKTTGDGILIEFSSAVDAVQHAVDVQRSMAQRNTDITESQRMEIRMGINVGDVIVDDDDLFGDGVNVAARLEGLAPPGGVCISGSVYEQVRYKLDTAFEDMGEQSVKNIDQAIRVYRINIGNQVMPGDGASAGAVDANFLQQPALAVLPFENLGGDPEQAYFADGLTEDIITALSLWRSFPVIARNSTFVYRGEAVKIQEVGRELGARYVLEGSVRRAGDRVRATAQLIDADTGHHVWAEKFDRQFEDIFDLQDELTQKIAAIVAPELERVEDNRAKVNQPQNLDAWHLVQRGMAFLDEYTQETNLHARDMFDQALKLDPTYSRAYSGLALAYARALMSGYEDSREAATDQAMEAARQAVALDGSDAYAHNMLGMACLWARQNKDAISSFQRAVELNPSYGHARASLGDTFNRMGRTDEGISLMEDALRLNPDAPNLRHINAFLARACINARRYEDAVEWARKAIHLRSDLAHAHCLMAVALAHLGRSEEARAALDECRRVQPDFFDSAVELRPYEDRAANEHLLDGLRKAGWQQPIDFETEPVQLPDKPSIAVLPFDNMSGDPEQDYFADGLVEDIITTLSKLLGLLVIARNSSFVYKGRSVDVREVARELGVRYVLEGSVRKGGDRIRITAQLIDADTGANVWAERYDRAIDDIFAVQDEITLVLATEMQVNLTEGEQARLRYATTSNFEAWTQWVQGLSHFRQPVTKDQFGPARYCWEKALALDPNSASLNGMLAFMHYADARFGWWDDRETALKKGCDYVDRALELDPENGDAHMSLSLLFMVMGRHEEAVVHARKSVELAPGSADAATFACFVLASSGHPEEAVVQIEKAMTLSPNYPANYLGHLGNAYRLSGRFDDAIAAFKAYHERNAGFGLTDLVIAYQQTDQPALAKQTAEQFLAIRPNFNIEAWVNTQFRSDKARLEAEVAALRAAGLPMSRM
jgi:adenylate cyclase